MQKVAKIDVLVVVYIYFFTLINEVIVIGSKRYKKHEKLLLVACIY